MKNFPPQNVYATTVALWKVRMPTDMKSYMGLWHEQYMYTENEQNASIFVIALIVLAE